jgi:hypothetical protein
LFEFLLGDEAALGVDLSSNGTVSFPGWVPMAPAATWTFCSRMALNDIHGRHATRGNAVRIEPDAHGIIAGAEHLDLADPGDAGQLIRTRKTA